MDQVNADEKLYIDYRDDKMTQITNLKFKTTADRAWITAHRGLFPDTNCWDYKPKCTTLTTAVRAIAQMIDTHCRQPVDGTCDIPHGEGREISEVDDINCDITIINSEEISDSMDLSNDEINANMTEIKQAQNQNDSSDPSKFNVDIQSVEQAYTKFRDSVISELGDMKESIKYLTEDMKKIPNRVSDRFRKDIESCKSSQHNYNQISAENEYLKLRITSLTRENQSQSNELWELKHEISDLKKQMATLMKAPAETQASATPHSNDSTTSTDAPRSQAAASPDAQLPIAASAETPLTSATEQPVWRSEAEPAPPRGLTKSSSGSPSQGAGSPTLQHRSSEHVITRPSSDSGDSTESDSSDNESIDYQPVRDRKAGRLQQKETKQSM